MTDHLKAGPLAGQDLLLLKAGSSVLRYDGHIVPFVEIDGGEPRVSFNGFTQRVCLGACSYIGERGEDVWITAPKGGWESNPIGNLDVEGENIGGTVGVAPGGFHDWPNLSRFRPAVPAPSTLAPTKEGENYRSLVDLHTIKGWLHGLATHPDLTDVVADGGVTAWMVYQQEAREFAGRVGRVIDSLSVQPARDVGAGEGAVMLADDAPTWADGIVTDGERVAFAQKAEADYGGTYWATDEGDGCIEWEPTHFIALTASSPNPPAIAEGGEL